MENLEGNKREDIVKECEKAIKLARELKDSDKHLVIRKLAEHYLKRIEMIEKICQVDKYNLFFNGQVGVGKTTAISHLTGLIDDSCFEKDKKVKEIPLLTVGSGRTTVCEMTIVPTDKQSMISVTKMQKEEFDKYVEEFCCILLEEEHNEQESPISAEVKRFICNMAKFPKDNGNASKNENDLKKYMQEAGVSVGDKDFKCGLVEAVKRNIDYENRNETDIIFTEGKFEDWLKKTLSEINHGRFPGIPFIKKLFVYINSKDMDLDIPEYIESIIDTRGMEAGSGIREDLVNQIEKETSITVMCDEVSALGGNSDVLTLLKHTLDGSGKDLYHRLFLLGLERNTELEDVNDADGCREKGMEIKRREAVDKLKERDILIADDHVNFYNTLHGLECTNSNKLIDIDKDKYNQEKEQFWNGLKKAITNMYEKYDIEILQIHLLLKKMSSGEIVGDVVSKFDTCKKYVDTSQDRIKEDSDFLFQLEKEIDSRHHGLIRACVNRQGQYDNFDIYFVSSQIGGDEFRRKCGEEKNILKRQIENLFDETDEIEGICRDAIESQIEMNYSVYYKKSCEHYSKCVYECLKDSLIWDKLYKYWGDGLGYYKKRIIYGIKDELSRKNLEKRLKLKNYNVEYMEGIKSFLSISDRS